MKNKKCEECRFWEPYNKGQIGESFYGICKRNPPTFLTVGVMESIREDGHWPHTVKEDWCGEFKKISGESVDENP